ncbi:TetR-like C-terminal domain-containing protein [Streptosporangium lutulentum]|uniref:Pimeloyl-ACP methyl ester carboxylesterase n=1 Tax=Streptosporangium lutulentum TaxID=1461250 RepID=A0ABT9QK14_9ACTN|nr:WHG domain-containing protein [Streptosporangium lutulentum]MDP9847057.1 pimeloyl-ACP methyl ester carboxylesterase [Streptosporangium lutulentum]
MSPSSLTTIPAGAIRLLGGPAVVVGHSFAGGAATIAAALDPELVSAIVEIAPFTRAQKPDLGGLLRNGRHRKGIALLMVTGMLRSVGLWMRYLDHAYPGAKPADYDESMAALERALRRPGRMAVVSRMGTSAPTDAGAQLPNLRVPALVLVGTLDPDWADLTAVGGRLVDIVLATLRAYGLEGADAIHATRCLRAAVHGFAVLEAAGGFGLPFDLDDSYELLAKMIIAGLPKPA